MAMVRCAAGVNALLLSGIVLGLLGPLNAGCTTAAVEEPDAKVRLTKLLRLYQVYVDRNKKGPANEQELRAFAQKLTPKERTDYLLGDDLETIYTSPRDNQPFVVRYNLKLEPGGPTRGVAWEATGQDGRRLVALSMGYVEDYDNESAKEYTK
jgi:hypothetical protein